MVSWMLAMVSLLFLCVCSGVSLLLLLMAAILKVSQLVRHTGSWNAIIIPVAVKISGAQTLDMYSIC